MSKDSLLFLFAGICALEAFVVLMGKALKWFPHTTPMTWVAIGIAASLLLSSWGFYRSLHAIPGFDPNPKLDPVVNKTFVNEIVVLDGKDFTHCTFENVSFVVTGQRVFAISHSTFRGLQTIRIKNPMFVPLIALQKAIGLIKDDTRIFGEEGLERIESPRMPDKD